MAGMKWKSEDWARLGEVIRKSRERQGYSRKRLSEMSGVSEKSIQLAEEGRVPTRWPKSIDSLVAALEWVPGTDKRVLEGYDPDSAFLDNSTLPAGGADYGADVVVTAPDGTRQIYQAKRTHHGSAVARPTTDWWFRQFDQMDLPEEIRKALPQVSFFLTSCVRHGAPEWMAGAFTNTAYMMLDEVHQKRMSARLKDQSNTVEESDERIRMLEAELARVRAVKELVENTMTGDAGADSQAAHLEVLEQLRELNERLDAISPEQRD